MTILTELTKPALKKQMRKFERAILKAKGEFVSNEVNHIENVWVYTTHKDLYLVDVYQEIEPTYMEIKRRFAKPREVTIPSKMNTDSEHSKETGYRWDYKKQN